MAVTVDQLKYILGLDIKGLQKNAASAEKRIDAMSNKMGSAFKRIGLAVVAYLSVRQLTSFVKSVTLTAARAEELAVVLENVGRTADYSAQYLMQEEEKIKALGITTQATRMLMIRFMQSQLDVALAAKIARAAQDFAVIGMVDSSEAAKMLTFAIAAQRPRLLRQFGIVTDLAEVFGKYAKTVGKSAQDLTEHEKRMSFYNVIMENAARITGTYEAAMLTAGKQFRSLQRYVIEASNAIGKYFLPVFSEFVNEMTAALKEIRKFFDPLSVMISEYTKLERIFNESTGTINKMVERYDELTNKTQKTKTEHSEYARIVDKLITLMPELSREYDAYGNIIIGNADALREVIKLHREELGLKKEETVRKLNEEIRATKKEIAGLSERYERLAGGEHAEYWAKMIKFTTEHLRKQRLELIRLEGQLRTLQPLYGPPEPEEIDTEKATKALQKAAFEQMMQKLDLDRKYEKITLAQYKQHLQNTLTAYELTEEQKTGIKRKIVEIGYQIEANQLKNYEAGLKKWNETYAKFIKERTEKVKEIEENKYAWLFEHEKIGVEQYIGFLHQQLGAFEKHSDDWIAIMQQIEDVKQDSAEKEKERWEAQTAGQREMLDVMLVGYDSFFDSLINRNLSVTEALNLAWQDLTQSILGYGADLLKQEIKNALLRKTTEAGVQKTKLAAIAAGSAKSIAWMAKEGAAALVLAAKAIYSAVAKIYKAHAGIPFVGVAIAAGFVGAMMASIGKFKKFAEGGLVGGLLAGQDQLLAALTKGEFVVPRRAVAAVGVPALEHMRRTGEMPSRTVSVNIDMGGFAFSGTKREDALMIKETVIDAVAEAVEEAINTRKLEI